MSVLCVCVDILMAGPVQIRLLQSNTLHLLHPYSPLLSTLFRSAFFSYGDGDLLRDCRGGFAPALRDSVWCVVRWMGIRQGGMKR